MGLHSLGPTLFLFKTETNLVMSLHHKVVLTYLPPTKPEKTKETLLSHLEELNLIFVCEIGGIPLIVQHLKV